MPFPREKATSKADLPHPFEGADGVSACVVCGGVVFDDRHGDWEKALERGPAEPSVPRETGI